MNRAVIVIWELHQHPTYTWEIKPTCGGIWRPDSASPSAPPALPRPPQRGEGSSP
jgi:hypothetical protein